jgi:hypothetical protein
MWLAYLCLPLALLLIAVTKGGPVLRSNLDALYFQNLLLSGTESQNRSPAEVAASIIEANGASPLAPHIRCRVETLRRFAYRESDKHVSSSAVSDNCLPITLIGTQPAMLPLLQFRSNWPVYIRGQSELEMRRNSSIWGLIYIHNPGRYQVDVEARCLGPEPAQLRLVIGDTSSVLEFGNSSSIESHSVELPSGINWVELSYINDRILDGKDRNLRLMATSIRPQ